MAGIVFLRCLLFLCSFLAHNNTPLCKIYLLLALFLLVASLQKGERKIFLFFNYHRSDLTVFVVGCLLILTSLVASLCGLAHRQISAALSSLHVRTVVSSSVSIPYKEYAPARTMTNAGVRWVFTFGDEQGEQP